MVAEIGCCINKQQENNDNARGIMDGKMIPEFKYCHEGISFEREIYMPKYNK